MSFCAWRMHCLLSERSIVWKKVCCFKALKTCVYENYFVSLVWGITNQKVSRYGYYTSTIGWMVAVRSLGLPGAQETQTQT